MCTVRPVVKAFFPLDKQLGLERHGVSPALSQEMVWLSGLLPYRQVAAVFERVGKQTIPASTLWEESQRQGSRLQTYVEQQQEQVGIERVQWNHRDYDARVYKSISMDGGMVYIRGEGWKEVKVGVIGDLLHAWTTEQHPTCRLQHLEYTAVLGDVTTFSQALWALAWRRGVPYAGRSAVTCDGAAWLWRVCADLFPDSLQIVDWYHARQHLAQAAQACYPHDSLTAQTWYERMSQTLFQGEVFKIIADLQQRGLPEHAHYFQTHHRRMQYQTFRAEGYPIGSGTVESGIKQYKQRLTGAGMRWSRTGAQQMLVIRSAILSDAFDALWAAA